MSDIPMASKVESAVSPIGKKERAPWSLGKKVKLALAGTLVAGILGYGGYEAANDFRDIPIPALHQTAEGTPFDINKLDTQTQTLVLGKNAREATPEEFLSIVNSPLPKINPRPKELQDLTTIPILLSLDLQKAGKVDVKRQSIEQLWDGKAVTAPMNFHISIENTDNPIGLFIPPGAINNNVEIFRVEDDYTIVEKFDLGNNKRVLIKIMGGFALTDITKDAPFINPNKSEHGNYIQDIIKNSGKNLNISDKPKLFNTTLTTAKYGLDIQAWYIEGDNNGSMEPISLPVLDGNAIFSTLH